jgi:imidazolonepropionase-like amidohydrolase
MRARLLAAALLVACNASNGPEITLPPSESTSDSLVLVFGASVIPMDRNQVLAQHSIVVRQGRIVQVAPAASIGDLAGAKIIDARGKYVLPGLIDMHVHMNRSQSESYVRHGITSVRNMWGFTALAGIIADINAGTLRGPAIYSLSSGFDGSPPKHPQTQLVDDLNQVAPLMQQQIDQGYREIKVYTDLTREAYDSIVAIARARGLTFAGHLPRRLSLEYVLSQGQHSIEHLGGYTINSIAAQARATEQAGTWVCPTLHVLASLNIGGDETRLRIVKGLYDGGVRLLVGTDAGFQTIAPGTSLFDELRLFVAAGLSPYDALRGATVDAAEYLGLANEIGRIASGFRADLVILDANPLRDIMAVSRIHDVMVRGELLGR